MEVVAAAAAAVVVVVVADGDSWSYCCHTLNFPIQFHHSYDQKTLFSTECKCKCPVVMCQILSFETTTLK